MTNTDDEKSVDANKAPGGRSVLSYLGLGCASGALISAAFGILVFIDHVESWDAAQRQSEQVRKIRTLEFRAQGCRDLWPLKGLNYEKCLRNVQRML
jgi:hypothetical protein